MSRLLRYSFALVIFICGLTFWPRAEETASIRATARVAYSAVSLTQPIVLPDHAERGPGYVGYPDSVYSGGPHGYLVTVERRGSEVHCAITIIDQ